MPVITQVQKNRWQILKLFNFHKWPKNFLCDTFCVGSGYFAVDGNLLSETILS